MQEDKTCPACGGALAYEGRITLGGRVLELYLCLSCGRGELYLPQREREERARARREAAADQAWLQEFQEKVRGGLLSAVPFLCPTCGALRREASCPHCGSVVDLETMEEKRPGRTEGEDG